MTPERTPAPWWALYALAAGVLVTFGGAMVASFALGDNTLSTTMATGALTLASLAVGYFFGSSEGSAKKSETLAKAVTSSPSEPEKPAP